MEHIRNVDTEKRVLENNMIRNTTMVFRIGIQY